MFAIVSYQSAFIVVNSALYFASKSAEITSLAQLVAKRLYDSGNGTINAEVTGRTTQIEVQLRCRLHHKF
jgi:hypothetical protein